MPRLTDLTSFSGTPALGDLLHIVDVSDTSQNAAGSSFKIALSDFFTQPLITARFAYLNLGAPDSIVVNGGAVTSLLQLNDDALAVLEVHTKSNTAGNSGSFYFARSRGTTGSPLVVQSGDALGLLAAVGYDGTDYALGGYLYFSVGSTPGANDMPTNFGIYLSADGSQTPTQRFGLTHNGNVTFGTVTTGVWNGSVIGVTYGGTGTGTQFTQGSLVFAGASGVYAQDNANLFWDDTNDRLGIGTTVPLYKLNFLTTDSNDSATHRPLVAFSDSTNPKYTVGIGSDHQTGIGQRFHIIAGEALSNSLPLTGLPRLTVRADGYVGINTSSPGSTLHIKDLVANDQLSIESGFPSGAASIKTIGTARTHTFGTTGATNGAGANLFFIYDATAGTLRMTIDTSGVADFRGQLVSRHGGGSGTYGLSQTPSLILGTSGSLAGSIKMWSPDSGLYSILQTTNGNLHLDPHTGAFGSYLNYYGGTAGVFFGSGANSAVAHISSAGYLTVGGTTGGNAIVSVGGGTIVDTNVKVQMSAAGTLAYYGVNRTNGNYGALFGFDSTYGVVIRSVNSADNISFLVSSTTNAAVFKPSGKFIFGGNLTENTDTFQHFQLGAIGTQKGLSIGMSNSFIRIREEAVANQMSITTNFNLSGAAQDSGGSPSWKLFMGNDNFSLWRSPAASTTFSELLKLTSIRMTCGRLASGYIDTTNIYTSAQVNILTQGVETSCISTLYNNSGGTNSLGYFTRLGRGTQSSPTAVGVGDYLGGFGAIGYDTTSTVATGGYLVFIAAENWGATSNGATAGIYTTRSGGTSTYRGILVDSAQSVVVGGNAEGALSTNATGGFLYLPTCAGAPTGTPTTYTGYAAFVWDSTNDLLYAYDTGWAAINPF